MTRPSDIPARPTSSVSANALARSPRRALAGFGQSLRSAATFVEPTSVAELREVFEQARAENVPLALRGSGRSYGDAALNGEGVVVSTAKMRQILHWDADTGIVECEPGVTIEDLWRMSLPQGYWPHVVPGTMFPTIAGCVAMNIHGKNHFCAGSFGDHVLEMDLLTPTGSLLVCSREENVELFHAVVGGFGMLGVVTRVRLQLKRVTSGDLSVEGITVPDLKGLFTQFRRLEPTSDYLVGWLDAFASGKGLGRSVIHRATHVIAGAPTAPNATYDLPSRFFGVPGHMMWRLLVPWVNNLGMRWMNRVKYTLARLSDRPGRTFLQSHVAFSFLLDYIPRWRDAYGKQGFIQVQPFLPESCSEDVFRQILELCQREKTWPFLAVVKRHKSDPFLMSHSLDGYSMAMDFKVTRKNRGRVWRVGQAIGDLTAQHGGKIYFAKDCVARHDQIVACYGADRLEAFEAHRQRCDPAGRMSSELSRRLIDGHEA